MDGANEKECPGMANILWSRQAPDHDSQNVAQTVAACQPASLEEVPSTDSDKGSF